MGESHQLEVQVAKLAADVEHIKTDVADIKIDLRRVAGSAIGLDSRLNAKLDGFEQRLTAKIDAMGQSLTGKIDAMEQNLIGRIDALRDEFASAKVWALGLYFGLAASMLLVMAKGFKWI